MRLLLLFLLAAFASLASQNDSVSDAITAMQQGDLQSAEQLLKAALTTDSRNSAALAVLAVVFDKEQKGDDAERAYKAALETDAHDPSLANNYANHLLVAGRTADARRMFLRSVALDPANRNANVQLATLAIGAKRSDEALAYLRHLSPSDRKSPEIERLLGTALSASGQYASAEEQFRLLAVSNPGDFVSQYDLGLAASKARHLDVAQQALRRALDLQPQNPDALYDLAVVDLKTGKDIDALSLLARDSVIAPDRAEVQRLLAQSTLALGYFDDSIRAWDKYLSLQPGDSVARRERAFAATAIGSNPEAALRDLTAYTIHFPKDAIGHYELGTALSTTALPQAAEELSRAIQLDPKLTSAYVARGLVSYRQGSLEPAIHDFAAAASQQPANPRILDRLGETYLAANHLNLALPVLRKAAAVAPDDPSVLLHLGRALTRTGQQTAAADFYARYRKLQHSSLTSSHGGGLIDFLSLSAGEQQARYRAGIERTVAAQPDNVEAQVKLLELLLTDGNKDRAAQVCDRIAGLRPEGEFAAEAGQALLDAEQYTLAEQFLSKLISSVGSLPPLQLELAQARFYTAGLQAALADLNQIDQGARTDSYYSARAGMLRTLGASGTGSMQ